ncbi:MAG: SpoIIE family protein phosphatase [Ramlibacter sp.]|jgi:sigma-B regulation protein RsbU (phosphoserine phosphatase)
MPGSAAAATPPHKPPEQRLFARYNWTLGTACTLIVGGLVVFFAFQLKQDLHGEISQVQAQVERHGRFMDFLMRASADPVDSLRTAIATHRTEEACLTGRRLASQGPLRQNGTHFAWNAGAGPTAAGRLEGDGPLLTRSPAFYCDLGAVIAVAPQLQAMVAHLAPVARAHVLSRHGFRFEAPWDPLPARHPVRAEAELWKLGQPAANPQGRRYWPAPYFGGTDLGLLAPVAAPVYDGEEFLGVVAVDIRLDFLNEVNAAMGYALGTVAVVDGHGRVLAHPAHAADPHIARTPGRFDQAFPPQVLPTPKALAALPAGQAVEQAGWVVMRRPLASAPWELVYTVSRTTLWRAVLLQRGPAFGMAVVALGLLMALTYGVTWRGFVGPAARLVGHAMAESSAGTRQQPSAPVPVPALWRPWFDAITRVFRESLQLSSLRRELDIAARMQQSILPRQWPQDPRFDLWGTMRPAKDVGGDYYDHFPLPQGRCGLVVADVSGKGISAGLFGMVSKTLLRAIATQREQPAAQVAREVNDALCADNESSMFVTTFYGQYDPARGRLVYANAGHPPPLVLRAQGSLEWLPGPGGTALGVMPGLAYDEGVVDLSPGDTLLVFTDGVTESINVDGHEFGRVRLSALFEGRPTADAREAITRLLERVERFAHGTEPFDDITCLALRCCRLGEPSPVPAEVPVHAPDVIERHTVPAAGLAASPG